MSGPPAFEALDHVLIGVGDLEAATLQLAALLGRDPAWRGEHPGAGTVNALFALENTTLELVAPDGQGADGERLRARLAEAGTGLLGLAFSTGDAARCRALLAERGLHPSAPVLASGRERDTGAVRAWRRVTLPVEETRGVLVLAVERTAGELPARPPADGRAAVCALDHVVIRSSAADATRVLYADRLGLRLALDRRFDDWGVRLLFFRIGGLTLEVAAPLAAPAGTEQAAAPDRAWGLSYRVPDLVAARARVAAAGFDVSELRAGRKPGTRVCTVRGEPCGVATLLIGPDGAE